MTAAERNKMLNDMKNAIALETDIAAQRQLMECCSKTMQEKCPVFVPLEKPVQRAQSVESPNKMHLILAWIMALLFSGTDLAILLDSGMSFASKVAGFLGCLAMAVGMNACRPITPLNAPTAFPAAGAILPRCLKSRSPFGHSAKADPCPPAAPQRRS